MLPPSKVPSIRYKVTCTHACTHTHPHAPTHTHMFILKGSSQKKFSRLQAGLHHVIVQFNPTLLSLDIKEISKEFIVPPKGHIQAIMYMYVMYI